MVRWTCASWLTLSEENRRGTCHMLPHNVSFFTTTRLHPTSDSKSSIYWKYSQISITENSSKKLFFYLSFSCRAKNRVSGKNKIFYDFKTWNNIFLLSGHKVDFIAPCGTNKSIFWPHSRKKIACNTGKTFILLVWLLPSLCSGIKLHIRKINFFSLVAQYTISIVSYERKNITFY